MTTTLQTRVLALFVKAAETAAPCPTNAEIVEATGLGDDRNGSEMVMALERRELIYVERLPTARRVQIVRTGKWTGWRLGHADQRGYRMVDEGYRGPPPEEQRVARDPCPRCGVRSDLGCGHSQAPLGLRMGL